MPFEIESFDACTASLDEIHNELDQVKDELQHVEYEITTWRGCHCSEDYKLLQADKRQLTAYRQWLLGYTVPF